MTSTSHPLQSCFGSLDALSFCQGGYSNSPCLSVNYLNPYTGVPSNFINCYNNPCAYPTVLTSQSFTNIPQETFNFQPWLPIAIGGSAQGSLNSLVPAMSLGNLFIGNSDIVDNSLTGVPPKTLNYIVPLKKAESFAGFKQSMTVQQDDQPNAQEFKRQEEHVDESENSFKLKKRGLLSKRPSLVGRRPPPYQLNILYKTQLCREFMERGPAFCPRGEACQFAHGLEDIHNPHEHPLYRTTLCKEFLRKGFCSKPDSCYHAHEYHPIAMGMKPSTASVQPAKHHSFNMTVK